MMNNLKYKDDNGIIAIEADVNLWQKSQCMILEPFVSRDRMFCYLLFKLSRGLVLLLIIITHLGLLSGCANSLDKNNFAGPITLKMKMDSTINWQKRTALVHLPKDFDPAREYPLLVVVHGAFSTAKKMEKETGFSEIADREGFIVIYPEGMGIFGFVQHWNAGHCCGKAAKDGLDDVAFLKECINKVAESVQVNKRQIFMTGFSNGGMLVYRYATEKTYDLAAIAVLGASIGGRLNQETFIWRPAPPTKPLPIMIVHGMADTTVPPEGGVSLQKGGTREYLPLQESIRFWLDANSCKTKFFREILASERIKTKIWENCRSGSSVHAYFIEGWAHRWPGPYFTKNDPGLSAFDISEKIWSFFQIAVR